MLKTSGRIKTRTVIQLCDVWASYDAKSHCLCNVKLSIDRGSNYAVVGASGSGKSTLVKLLNGMMMPSRGQVRMDYQRPDTASGQFRHMMHKIGYIPQNLGLVKNLTVLQNVLVGALPRMGAWASLAMSFPEEEVREAMAILGRVGLGGKDGRKVHMLSGGERRRVAIARALMQKPDVLLADEIVSELDGRTAREIMDIIAAAQRDTGLTAVMVHHDMKLALEYADRVAVMRDGEKILEIGVEGDTITDFQTGDMTQEQILGMYDARD